MNEKALNTYFLTIKKHYPTAKKEDVEVLCCGYAHTVLKIHNQIFRFPKTKESARNMLVEESFSRRFSAISPIPIPAITHYSDSASQSAYQMYEYISGVPFTKEYSSHLEEHELIAIAASFGKFLTELHAFPLEEAKSLSINPVNTPEEFAQYFRDIISEDEKAIGSLLTSYEWGWIEKNTEIYYALCLNHSFQLKFTHADLLPKHILIDERTHRLNGIIDFSLKIADPAIDFRYFDRYGDLFLKIVYDNYPMRDPYFDKRRKFYAGDYLLGHLYLTTQQKDPEEQKTYVKELREYIAAHPLE